MKSDQDNTEKKNIEESIEESYGLGVEITTELSFRGIAGNPAIKSLTIRNPSIQSLAKADPSNVQEVAASQIEIVDEYYGSVLDQAKKSFCWALVAAASGLIFFLVAIGSLVYEKLEKVSYASLIGGALVEVIAGVNFYLYLRASDQLSRFHTRLDVTQRFLLANSLCENLEGEIKHKTRAELVKLIANLQISVPEEKF